MVATIERLDEIDFPKVLIHMGPRTRYSDASLGQAVVDAANRFGVRVYHYPNNDVGISEGRAALSHVGIAKPTGGRSFSDTDPVKKVVTKIVADLQCLYVLDLDSTDLESGKAYEVMVQSRRKRVSVAARQQILAR